MLWLRVHKTLPTELVVTAPELEGRTGFLGVYPKEGDLLEARVYRGRALWKTLVQDTVEYLYLNAVGDPRVLWDVFRDRARARWAGKVYCVDSSYLVLKTRVTGFWEEDPHSSRLLLSIVEAWQRPGYASPPSRVVGNLLNLMVALSRVEPLCTSSAERLWREIDVSLSFLRRRLSTSPYENLLREIEEEVKKAVERCPPLAKELSG